MVDRVYKKQLPALRKTLEKLGENFSNLDSKTDWAELRIEPLLKHLRSLEQLLESSEFSGEFSRLTKGVEMFHSDLIYFRTNVKVLEKILQSEEKSLERKTHSKVRELTRIANKGLGLGNNLILTST